MLLGLTACGGNVGTNETSESKALRLEREVAEKDSLLNDLFASLNQIAGNLTQIKDREGIITTNLSSEISREQRVQISEDIAAIDQLLEQNRLSLQRLHGTTEELRRARIKVTELEALVARFTRQIQDKDRDIDTLRAELETMHIRVGELNTKVESLQANVNTLGQEKQSLEGTLVRQDLELNTVYYIVGSERSLREQGIVEKSGFIGRTLKVPDSYNPEPFTSIDRRQLDRIVVGQRRSTIVTSHPEGSYQRVEGRDGQLEEIRITDPERFWEMSRILVVSYK